MSGVITSFGVKCANAALFYVCENKPSRFIGCCNVDPCATVDGGCPADQLDATIFTPANHAQIPPRECFDENNRSVACGGNSASLHDGRFGDDKAVDFIYIGNFGLACLKRVANIGETPGRD
ncbi:GPR1 [Purpureocillium lavendulum]|uniref:GPR1 n=1 Tax=Purpureocillium lavendulum TaxID=1247861 RepID=A0AB34G2N3_9HYPO|nr:GPR1 [Purpureocillium lavendulum]